MVARLRSDLFYLISTPRAERWNFDDLSRLLPKDGSVQLRIVTDDRGAFHNCRAESTGRLAAVDGDRPFQRSLSLVQRSVRHRRHGQRRQVAARQLFRRTVMGTLPPACYQRHLLDALLASGAAHGLRLVGLQALESLRLDKSYRPCIAI